MNLEDVSRYIQQPSSLTLAAADSLKSMSEKHPYAAVFSLLYLTALANGKSIDLEHALQEHAYRLSDRTQLYYLVHQEGLVAEINEVNNSESIVAESESIIEMSDSTTETTLLTPEPEETENPITEVEKDDLFITETVAFTLEQEYIPEPLPITEELQKEEPIEAPVSDSEETISIVPKTDPTPQDSTDLSERRSFTSWLKSNHGENAQSGSETNEAAHSKMAASDIIDRFIAEEPSISRPKNEFFSPPKKAKESLDENAIPVSETLAKIYAAQGNYPKAIHVYHQLMLAFPEKKLLFAVRIEELKKKITT